MKYTDEEKKIIEDLKECEDCHYRDNEGCLCEVNSDYKKTILSVIEKQQKEIDRLEERSNYYEELAGKYQGSCVPKCKIKEKIKVLEQVKYDKGEYKEINSINELCYEYSKSLDYEVAQLIIKILKEILGE